MEEGRAARFLVPHRRFRFVSPLPSIFPFKFQMTAFGARLRDNATSRGESGGSEGALTRAAAAAAANVPVPPLPSSGSVSWGPTPTLAGVTAAGQEDGAPREHLPLSVMFCKQLEVY